MTPLTHRLDNHLTSLWLDRDAEWSWPLVLSSLALALAPALVLGLALAPVGLGALASILLWPGLVFTLAELSTVRAMVARACRVTAATLVLVPVVVFLPAAWYTPAGGAVGMVSGYLWAIVGATGASILLAALALAALLFRHR